MPGMILWQFGTNLGQQAEGPVSNHVSGLESETNYWFRFYATNVHGGTWAEPSLTFMTRVDYSAGVYVTPAGAGSKDGKDWANAFDSIQDAIDAASANDRIYLRYGTYTLTSTIDLTGKPDRTIAGGYLGVGATLTNAPSILTQGGSIRILTTGGEDAALERLTIRNGYQVGAGAKGAGIYNVNGSLTVSNCVFDGNHLYTTAYDAADIIGGAIYQNAGQLYITGTLFTNNYLDVAATRDADAYGGAIAAINTTLTVTNCTFAANYLDNTTRSTIPANPPGHINYSHGGAVYLSGGTAGTLTDCRFDGNYIGTGYTMQDSIVWSNGSGSMGGSATVDYSDIQGGHAGTLNIAADPVLLQAYYLDAASTPCDDVGSATAATYGMDQKTTRIDKVNDADTVDMGYHHDGGGSPFVPVNDLYVKTDGNDELTGTNWVLALKTMTKALDLANNDVTIIDSLISDNVITVTKYDGADNSGGGLYSGDGVVLMSGTTFEGNRINVAFTRDSSLRGGAVALRDTDVTITNCTFNGNYGDNAVRGGDDTSYSYGGAIYISGGAGLIVDCSFGTNYLTAIPWTGKDDTHSAYGGAIYAVDVNPLTILSTPFSEGYIDTVDTDYDKQGSVLCVAGASSVVLSKCDIRDNDEAGSLTDVFAHLLPQGVVSHDIAEHQSTQELATCPPP